MKSTLSLIVLSFSLTITSVALAEDFEPKSFLQAKCSGCHDSSVYTRKNRRVQSMEQLEAQVRRCDANLGVKLFDDDVNVLVQYLNDQFYKFGK
ncbi:MAG: cytochrome c [bacterium]